MPEVFFAERSRLCAGFFAEERLLFWMLGIIWGGLLRTVTGTGSESLADGVLSDTPSPWLYGGMFSTCFKAAVITLELSGK